MKGAESEHVIVRCAHFWLTKLLLPSTIGFWSLALRLSHDLVIPPSKIENIWPNSSFECARPQLQSVDNVDVQM